MVSCPVGSCIQIAAYKGRQFGLFNKTNTSDTDASFLYLHLFISNDIVSTKIYDKRDDSILKLSKKVSEYDQEIPQSQTADNSVAPRGRAAQPSRDTRKTN